MSDPTTARIDADVIGQPPIITLTAHNVPPAVWYEVGLILHGSERQPGGHLHLTPASLIENRRRLVDLLLDASIRLEATPALAELLMRANRDERAFTDALSVVAEDEPLDLEVALTTGPHVVIRTLRDFQEEDLAKLARLAHGANFSVPGAGKTTVAYALHALIKAEQRADKLLVVAPLSAFGAWEEDATEVLDPPPRVARMNTNTVPNADVVLINYQRLPTNITALAAWAVRHRVHLVVDEAHRAKRGISGEWGRALMTLAPLAVRRDVLTGTPAPNHPRDLVALLDFLWPSKRASARIPSGALATDPTTTSVRAVSDAISPFFVRTNKARLGLPDPNINYLPVPMEGLQHDIYQALKNRYAGHLSLDARDAAAFARMGEITMYLLQAASSPRLLRNSADPARAYRFPPLAIPAGSRLAEMVEQYADFQIPAKFAAVARLVAANADQGLKTLVWSNFPDNLLDLQIQLAHLEPAVIYGGVPSIDESIAPAGMTTRERELARFKTDDNCKVLLANPAAMSEGVSLHRECHEAIYIDRTFNAGQYLQSLDRIHRLGLDPDIATNVTILCSPDTIDDTVNRRVKLKTERLSAMLSDEQLVQMALPDEDDGVVFLDDSDDLEALLAHLGHVDDPNADNPDDGDAEIDADEGADGADGADVEHRGAGSDGHGA